MKRAGAACCLLAVLLSFGPRTTSEAAKSRGDVLGLLVASGLGMSDAERGCARRTIAEASRSTSTATNELNPVSSQTADSIGRILGCISQEEAVKFIAGALDADSSASAFPTSAFVPRAGVPPTKDCLTRRLRVATWHEVTEAFRSYAEALLSDFDSGLRGLLASRVRPYAATCTLLKDSKGTTPLPPLSLEDVRVRWNASVRRRPLTFAPVSRWVSGRIPSTVEAVVAAKSWVSIATSGSTVVGVTVALTPPVASRASALEALGIVADVLDGRDQAVIVGRAIDVSSLLAADQPGQSKARIGRTLYTVTVVGRPTRVFIDGSQS